MFWLSGCLRLLSAFFLSFFLSFSWISILTRLLYTQRSPTSSSIFFFFLYLIFCALLLHLSSYVLHPDTLLITQSQTAVLEHWRISHSPPTSNVAGWCFIFFKICFVISFKEEKKNRKEKSASLLIKICAIIAVSTSYCFRFSVGGDAGVILVVILIVMDFWLLSWWRCSDW